MATQNVRVVGYLPPHYRERLHQYMEAESLTERSALVKIVKKFFDGTPAPQATEKAKDDEIARVKGVWSKVVGNEEATSENNWEVETASFCGSVTEGLLSNYQKTL